MGKLLWSSLVYRVRQKNLADLFIKMVLYASAKKCSQRDTRDLLSFPQAFSDPLVQTHNPLSPLVSFKWHHAMIPVKPVKNGDVASHAEGPIFPLSEENLNLPESKPSPQFFIIFIQNPIASFPPNRSLNLLAFSFSCSTQI